jgi:hypothetical protein
MKKEASRFTDIEMKKERRENEESRHRFNLYHGCHGTRAKNDFILVHEFK